MNLDKGFQKIRPPQYWTLKAVIYGKFLMKKQLSLSFFFIYTEFLEPAQILTHCFSLRKKGVRGKNLSDRSCFLKGKS